jgi:starvation-inducible DNA-binding protein
VLVLFVRTKSFHWHIGGRHCRSDHLLLDEHATQIISMVDDNAERIRKIGGTAIRSVGDVARNQRLADHEAADCSATDMLQELLDDNRRLTAFLRQCHELCDRHGDLAAASLIENWIDETERRVWFLTETTGDRERAHP